jgi:hypothetical protein
MIDCPKADIMFFTWNIFLYTVHLVNHTKIFYEELQILLPEPKLLINITATLFFFKESSAEVVT